MNAFGEKIWGVIRLNHFDGTNAIIETRKGFKKDYRPTITYPNSYYEAFTRPYLDLVENKVLEYLLEIDITTLKCKTKELATLKGKYEFGRDLENQNYYQTIKSTKLIKGKKQMFKIAFLVAMCVAGFTVTKHISFIKVKHTFYLKEG